MSWTPPTDTSGVTGYRIYYTEKGGSEQSEAVHVRGADARVNTICDLTTSSTYSIKIEATSNGHPSAEVGPEEITLGMRYFS